MTEMIGKHGADRNNTMDGLESLIHFSFFSSVVVCRLLTLLVFLSSLFPLVFVTPFCTHEVWPQCRASFCTQLVFKA